MGKRLKTQIRCPHCSKLVGELIVGAVTIPDIKEGVSIPLRKKGRPILLRKKGRPIKYDFANMGVGDSFFVVVGDEYPKAVKDSIEAVRDSIASAYRQFIRSHAPERKFSTEMSERGVRIKRVK